MALTPDQFRQLMSRFASGITVLTAVDAHLRPHGMTVSAFSSLSLDPPLVLVCVDRSATMLDVLDASSHFAVNILAEGQEALSRRFSLEEMELRFEGVGHSTGIAGLPVLHGALATLECRRSARHDAGDHAIFIGEVVGGTLDPAARPLVYYAGAYGRVER
ncbi:MAG: flavin reductase family protein [Cytophagaceae bacterium]|nr:flavin reductase family protein [Gemmatimonadaceae bacterium]